MKKNLFIFVIFCFFLSACAPAASIDDPQSAVQTIAAATIAARPSNTPRPAATSTRRPTQIIFTPTPIASLTPIFTITPLATNTPDASPSSTATDLPIGGGEVGKYQGQGNFACMVMGQKPADWTKVRADKLLYMIWTVKNVGAKEWRQGALEIVHLEGEKMYEYGPSQELAYNIPPGDTRDIVVVLHTPKRGGDYWAKFGLQHDGNVFCNFRVGISVR